jgi:hypothetical protein
MNRMIGAMLGIFTFVGIAAQSAQAQAATVSAEADIAKAIEQAVSEALSQPASGVQVKVISVGNDSAGGANVTPEQIDNALKAVANDPALAKTIQDAINSATSGQTSGASAMSSTQTVVKVITIKGDGTAGDADLSKQINDALKQAGLPEQNAQSSKMNGMTDKSKSATPAPKSKLKSLKSTENKPQTI